MPEGTVEAVAGGGREELGELARQRDLVDLIIPRGGEGLKAALEAVAEVPILYAASGNCHVYVDADADLEMARGIAYNAKVQRPGVCNAAETLLVHESVAGEFLPAALGELSRTPASSWSATSAPASAAGGVGGRRGERRGLGSRVPRAEDGGGRRRLGRATRSITSTGTAAATPRRS